MEQRSSTQQKGPALSCIVQKRGKKRFPSLADERTCTLTPTSSKLPGPISRTMIVEMPPNRTRAIQKVLLSIPAFFIRSPIGFALDSSNQRLHLSAKSTSFLKYFQYNQF